MSTIGLSVQVVTQGNLLSIPSSFLPFYDVWCELCRSNDALVLLILLIESFHRWNRLIS